MGDRWSVVPPPPRTSACGHVGMWARRLFALSTTRRHGGASALRAQYNASACGRGGSSRSVQRVGMWARRLFAPLEQFCSSAWPAVVRAVEVAAVTTVVTLVGRERQQGALWIERVENGAAMCR